MIKNIEINIGKYLFKNPFHLLFIVNFISLLMSISFYLKEQNIIYSFILFISFYFISFYLLNNFIKSYSYFNIKEMILKLISSSDLKKEDIIIIFNNLINEITNKLLKDEISINKIICINMIKEEFKKTYNIKLPLKDYNIIKNSFEEFEVGIYQWIEDIYFEKKIKNEKMKIFKNN